jgi:hypothetical protein
VTVVAETTSDAPAPAAQEPPYVTIVATSRNDDHGGGMTRRMQTFVNALVAQCDRYTLPAELLLVDWNPPGDRPPLADAFEWPPSAGYCRVRVVQVPHDLHRRLTHSDRLPLFQMIAKNVGIRRAAAPFVVATNVDVVFSDGLMRFLARRRLDPGRVYRVDRLDIADAIDPSWPVERQLAFCRGNVIRVNARNGTKDLRTGEFFRIYPRLSWMRSLPTLVSLPIEIAYVAWRKVYARAYWFVAGFNDPRQVPRRIKRRLRMLRGRPAAAAVEVVPRRPLFRSRVQRFREDLILERARMRMHTNASGDFTLMSKDAWLRSRGYLEFEMYSMHIDGLQLFQARYTGTREKFVRHGIYHIEHDAGFKPDPKGEDTWAERFDRQAIPRISNEELSGYIVEMYRTRKPMGFNRDDWGLANEQLPERSIRLPPRPVGYRA